MERKWSADEIEAMIAKAIKARDFQAVVTLLKLLVAVDARRAEDVYDSIQLAIAVRIRADSS